MFTRNRLFALALAILVQVGLMSQSAIAEEVVEEVVVTGSYIRGSSENAEVPVDVLQRTDLEELGSPTLVEMIRNLGVASGNVGETNQFQSGASGEGRASVNLRGLGSARTLVLFNGRRHVSTNPIGVDLSFIPTMAIGRVEVLKDGAAALYGSDAIGGVVNFITRSGFEGFEATISHQAIDDSDGDSEVGAIFGWSGENVDFMIAGEYKRRSELRIRDRDWALRPFSETPQGGWSTIGNPGSIFGLFDGFALRPDPQCEQLGGEIAGFCRFQYTYFDNLIEDEDQFSVHAEMDIQLSDDMNLFFEAAYSKVELDEWKTSPSYPPQTLLGADRVVLPSHPGLVALFADNPGLLPSGLQPVISWSRAIGVAGINGGGESEVRETEQMRFVAGLEGTLNDGAIDYTTSVTYSKRERYFTGSDTYVERMAFALKGLGGANCDPLAGSPGVGDCSYFNPFSNAIARSPITGFTNPQFDPALANSPEIMDWLISHDLAQTNENELIVFDAVMSGISELQLGGGPLGWAVGAQVRDEEFKNTPNSANNLSLNPCPWTNPASVAFGFTTSLDCTGAETGSFAFLSGSDPRSDDRTVWGVFGELALPITDTLDMQLAVRYEDYGGDTGSTTDPKIALRWQVAEPLAFRASASTTFRGPALSSLGGRTTALGFVAPANAFKAIDTVGNPNLKAESAVTFNVGVLVEFENFSGSIDWWRFDFEDRIGVESAGQVVAAYATNGCQDGGAGVGSGVCDALRAHIFPTGVTAAALERIDVSAINSSDVETSGLDFKAEYSLDLDGGYLTVGIEGTYTLELTSDDFLDAGGVRLAGGGDFAGKLNETNPFTPLPEIKGNLYATYDTGRHNLRYAYRYVDAYEDDNAPAGFPSFRTIDKFGTHDIHYNFRWTDKTRVSFSIFNALDEDPSFVSNDLNYDPFSHSAFGRMFKVGITHSFE